MTPASARNLSDLVQQIALGRIASDRLELPAMPATAARCLVMLRADEVDFGAVTTFLARDPMLTAQLLRLANSAAYGGSRADSILQAVNRLGAKRLVAVLVETAARQLFASQDAAIDRAFHGIWEHSVAVGLLARDTARMIGAADPETVFLAGLLHDVGKPVVAAMLLETERTIGASTSGSWIQPTEWLAAVQDTHRAVGAAIALKWHLPEAVASCVRDSRAYDTRDRIAPANVVRFANALAKQAGVYVGDVDGADTETLVAAGRELLVLDEEVVAQMASDLLDRIQTHLN